MYIFLIFFSLLCFSLINKVAYGFTPLCFPFKRCTISLSFAISAATEMVFFFYYLQHIRFFIFLYFGLVLFELISQDFLPKT